METPSRIAELERKFGENPRRYFAALANEYRKAGEIERAVELCQKHLAEQRNHLSGHVVLAQALVDSGRDADAWEPLHTALDLDPENFIALRLLGELSARAADAEQARGYFFRALEIEPRNDQVLEALKNLGGRRDVEDAQVVTPAADATASDRALRPLPGLPPLPEPTVAERAEAAAEPVAEPAPEPATPAPQLVRDMWGDLRVAEAGERVSDDDTIAAEPRDDEQEPAAVADQAGVVPDESDWAERPAEPEPVAAGDAGEDVWSGWEVAEPGAHVAEPGAHVAEPGADVAVTGGDVAEPRDGGSATADEVEEEVTVGEARPGYFSLSDEFAVPAREIAAAGAGSAAADSRAADATERALPAAEVPAVTETEETVPPAVEPEPRAESRPTLVSETMVELYLAQGHTAFAIEALRDLVSSRPGDERLRARLEELQLATTPQPKETVRDLFARLGRGRARPVQAGAALAGAFAERKEDGPVARFFGGEGSSGAADDPALVAVFDDTPTAVPDAAEFESWLRGMRR